MTERQEKKYLEHSLKWYINLVYQLMHISIKNLESIIPFNADAAIFN